MDTHPTLSWLPPSPSMPASWWSAPAVGARLPPSSWGAPAIASSTTPRATSSSSGSTRRRHEGPRSHDHESDHYDAGHAAQGSGSAHGPPQGERPPRRLRRQGGRDRDRGGFPPPGGRSRPAVSLQPAHL